MEDWEKEGLIKFESILSILISIIIGVIIGYTVGYTKGSDTRPVEEIVKADSLIKVNDSIKIKVNNLDSIKNAKVIEVQTLDNDSTAKLFYELINK